MNRLMGFLLLLLPFGAWAEVVGPIDSVENFVNVRMSADSTSEIVGRLNQGDYLPLVSSNDEWLEVEIAGGATGFISSDWVVVHAKVPPIAEEDEVVAAVDLTEEVSVDAPDTNGEPVEVMAASIDQAAEIDEGASTVETIAETATKQTEEGVSAAVDIVEPSDDTDISVEAVAAAIEEPAAVKQDLEEQVEFNPNTEVGIATNTVSESDDIAEAGAEAEAVAAAEIDSANETSEAIAVVDDVVADIDDATIAEPEGMHAVAIAPVNQIAGPAGMMGPPGPKGEPGPPGPPGAGSIEGSVGFLARFAAPTVGASSQIYDDGNNIGIGTTTPVQRLEVNGNIQIHEQNSSVAGLMITQSDGETGYIMHNQASTLTIGAGSIDRITIDSDGNVGFGVARPAHPIEMANGAHVTAGGVWTNSSSRERKENIAALSAGDALAALTSLEPVQYNYKNDQLERYVGFIAEDVPDLVATVDRDGLSSMDIVAVLTKVVQEQQKKIEELEARLDQR